MSTSPKSIRIMTSACSFHVWPHSHLNMDLSIHTPTWHCVYWFGKYSGFPNPTGSHPVLQLQTTKANKLITLGTRFFGRNLTIGLFTVAIFGPFSAHFRSHFWIIFRCLAEKWSEWSKKWNEKWCEKWLLWTLWMDLKLDRQKELKNLSYSHRFSAMPANFFES